MAVVVSVIVSFLLFAYGRWKQRLWDYPDALFCKERSVRVVDDGKRNWKNEIKEIRKLDMQFTKHFKKQIRSRRISLIEIKNAIQNGKIIQGHAPGEYGNNEDPVRVILGYGNQCRSLHIVVAIRYDALMLVTAYEPDMEIWEKDFKTLKKRG
ncbi:hypothetical protein Dtox_2464 [Desulfofarcimen acetoxidans DSM 771]|uniref:DUF4258 domain-containing protein n=1 Tax=Desulfofarcimen acetoxidans (strain ATCC 49208 / DSM 771 / KCTC 5769 / VKM B-1644 / 5575) TaxID=485916 RepID=C8W0L8_DESAS|nr:hypothetical protein Dtox_2464 [Desulfofarcimen acetoxidans DSM 771]